jgi:aspartate/methionine/tyrosine aminotransferase
MKKFISLCKKYNLFTIVDEIYEKLIFDKTDKVSLASVIDDVP